MNFPAILFVIMFSATSNTFIRESQGQPSSCAGCPRTCQMAVNLAERDCIYGYYSPRPCEVRCYRGPGQTCGYDLTNVQGLCGSGTGCECGRCAGCSLITAECAAKERCIEISNRPTPKVTYFTNPGSDAFIPNGPN